MLWYINVNKTNVMDFSYNGGWLEENLISLATWDFSNIEKQTVVSSFSAVIIQWNRKMRLHPDFLSREEQSSIWSLVLGPFLIKKCSVSPSFVFWGWGWGVMNVWTLNVCRQIAMPRGVTIHSAHENETIHDIGFKRTRRDFHII